MARGLEEKTPAMLDANRADLERARAAGRRRAPSSTGSRSPTARIEAMAVGLREIAALPDPVGETVEAWRRPTGLEISRVRVPLGVDRLHLRVAPQRHRGRRRALREVGQRRLLRGGSEAIESNALIAAVLAKAIEKAGAPRRRHPVRRHRRPRGGGGDAQAGRADRSHHPAGRRGLRALGGRALARPRPQARQGPRATSSSTPPPTSTWRRRSCINAKAHRPSVCNALETLLVRSRRWPTASCPWSAARLARGRRRAARLPRDAGARARARGRPARPTGTTEYLDLILAIRVVDGLDAAIAHIRRHGTGLAEAIVTNDLGHARRFTREVDAAAVLVNASTRLVDGSQFGWAPRWASRPRGVHARGPVGVRELTTTKFIVQGDGQIRD